MGLFVSVVEINIVSFWFLGLQVILHLFICLLLCRYIDTDDELLFFLI